MKNTPLKNAFVTASLLVAVGHAGIASADSLVGALGARAGATDLYQVTCSTDAGGVTHHLETHVKDNAPVAAPLVSVQTHKGALATNSTDATDGNATYSRNVQTHAGDGVYYVIVDKSATGAELYTLEYHCKTIDGEHTGTSIIVLQNQ